MEFVERLVSWYSESNHWLPVVWRVTDARSFTVTERRRSRSTPGPILPPRRSVGLLLGGLGDVMEIAKHMELLGHRVEDRITCFTGVVASISFDLYGCVQAIVNPGKDKDGKLQDQCWFDVSRLRVTSENFVMDVPNFECGPVAEGKQGPAQ